MNTRETIEMMQLVANGMVASEPALTKYDQAIGDGDHGLGIERGFSNVATYLNDDFSAKDVGDVMTKVGTKLMSTMGGASGAIFGTLFRAGGKAIAGEAQLTTSVLARFLEAGLAGIYKRGGASEGAKTMIDALVPAMRCAQQQSEVDFEHAIVEISEAAEKGVENTKEMIATTGKAKTLGERSLGHPDPGAISMSLILKFMAEYVDSEVMA
ncbi:dihydroxyacetone kinase [Photobacterium gaetbulicola]|uniref:Dihydroxyacetone kinase n=1 Tax=Photobacterium gaetbulicola TaxID=1295392 RepID=A0A0B9G0C9_9GAMM|nr:dihydroxyacetone kinase subunit DhaL [Photobacterium gaetbulicola]KHT58330.1 dihydroxyacetone kinase [Photobacterium gaetbulicola]